MTFRRRPSTRARLLRVGLVVILLAIPLGAGVVATNTLGAGDRFESVARRVGLFLNPPPDRPIDDVLVTPRPSSSPSPTATPFVSLAPGQTPPPTPEPTPEPSRVPVDVSLLTDPANHFITEVDHEWCAVAGVQMVLEINGKASLSKAFQKELAGRIGEWESRRDSHNGGWGPTAMTKALAAYGVPGYQVRAYETRQDAMADAARAVETLHAPVLLLAWRGAHTWVMTGFRADADPVLFDDAKVTGTYILDPWYPIFSSIWGNSDPPGTFQDLPEMRRNYLPWKRPEGTYAGRDGLFIAVVPTQPLLP